MYRVCFVITLEYQSTIKCRILYVGVELIVNKPPTIPRDIQTHLNSLEIMIVNIVEGIIYAFNSIHPIPY